MDFSVQIGQNEVTASENNSLLEHKLTQRRSDIMMNNQTNYTVGGRNSNNKILVPGSEQVIDQMKMEIAQEFGVQLGADATARQNGSVGGEITKRLVAMAQQQLANQNGNNGNNNLH